MKKVAIIGAGPAGMTAAYELSRQGGFDVSLFESSSQVGGLSKSISLWNHTVDLGPHRFFSDDPRVNRIWKEVVGNQYHTVNRQTRIFYKEKLISYPLEPLDVMLKLGLKESILCVLSFLRLKLRKLKPEETFQAWVTNRFGSRLYEIFFKTYSEKLWGISCEDLNADFAVQRIKKFSLASAILSAFGFGKKPRTLADQFSYPLEGTGFTYTEMAKRFVEAGGKLFLNTRVEKLVTEKNEAKGIEFADGQTELFDHIISTMPLTQLVGRISELPAEVAVANSKLRFRNTILVYLLVKKENLFSDQWLYIHTEKIQCGRITNFANWIPNDSETAVLAMEYWSDFDGPLWNLSDSELKEMAQREIEESGLLTKDLIQDALVYRIPHCYPIYEKNYRSYLSVIENYLQRFQNLAVIGRYGSFKYNNQDHSILMGHLAAMNLIKGLMTDLWSVNSDQEYQESALAKKN